MSLNVFIVMVIDETAEDYTEITDFAGLCILVGIVQQDCEEIFRIVSSDKLLKVLIKKVRYSSSNGSL